MRALRRPPRPGSVPRVYGTVEFPPINISATKENLVMQSVWVGKTLSTMEQLCIRSFLANGHKFHLYTYGELSGVPEGTVVLDANEILPEKEVKDFKHIANFSDLFRYTMLTKGGWYVDMDSVCLRPLEFSSEYVFAAAACNDYYQPVDSKSSSAGCYVENGYIKVPEGNQIMPYCRDLINFWKKHPDQNYCEPMRIIQKGIAKFELEKFVQPPAVFDPLPFYKRGEVVNPWISWDLRGAYVVHLIRSGWGSDSQIEGDYYDACLYERLKKKYL